MHFNSSNLKFKHDFGYKGSLAMTEYVGRGSDIAGWVLASLACSMIHGDSFVSFSLQGENESLAGEAKDQLKQNI